MIDKVVPSLFGGLFNKNPQGAGSQPQTNEGFNPVGDGLRAVGKLGGVDRDPSTNSQATTSKYTLDVVPTDAQPTLDLEGASKNTVSPTIPKILQVPAIPEPFIIPPAPTSQFEGKMIRTEVPGGYIELPEQETKNLLGDTSKLETEIPILTSSIDNLTAAITNNPITSNFDPTGEVDFSDVDFDAAPRADNRIGKTLLSGATQKLGGGSWLNTGLSIFSGLLGFATGGIKEGIAPIRSGIIGSGRSQVDNRLALVEDGEGVLTHLGVDTLGGASALAKINKGIKIPMFATGGIKGANYSTPTPNTSVPNISPSSSNFNNISVGVNITNSGKNSSVETIEDGSKLGKLVNNAISMALIKESRPGGLLYS